MQSLRGILHLRLSWHRPRAVAAVRDGHRAGSVQSARGYPMTLNLCVNPSYWKFEAMMRPGRSTFAYSSV